MGLNLSSDKGGIGKIILILFGIFIALYLLFKFVL